MDTDSISNFHRPIPDHCNITLDILQSIFYRTGKIHIYSPDGMRLESIGYCIKRTDIEATAYRLKEQMYLIECLLGKLTNNLELPADAVSALADLLYRMQGFCREYIK